MRSTIERFLDIKESIANIEEYTKEGRKAFDEKNLIREGVILNFLIIGEAVRSLPIDFRNSYSHVPWKQISGMRDMLIHRYFAVDKEIVWTAVERDIPILKAAINEGLESFGESV